MNVAVITARAGSKRVPGKNIRSFLGSSMLDRSIKCCRDSELFDSVIVSTDSEKIAQVARSSGAEVPFIRPQELADDFATTLDVMSHAASWFKSKVGERVRSLCCVYPTSPFLLSSDLRFAYEVFGSGIWDYVFSATECVVSPYRTFKKNEAEGVTMLFPQYYSERSQDLPKTLHDGAQFYIGKLDSWLEKRPIFSANSSPFLLPDWRVIDIDTEDDWQKAEVLAPYIYQRIARSEC